MQAVYFVKRRADVVKKDTFKTLVAFGDVSHLPLDQLNSMVESVSPPLTVHTSCTMTHYLLSSVVGVPYCSQPGQPRKVA